MYLHGLALLVAPLIANQVWIVDAQLGTGAQYASIQPAVQAALDGDVILVRSGHYPTFQVGSKSLAICADFQSLVEVDGPLKVEHQAP